MPDLGTTNPERDRQSSSIPERKDETPAPTFGATVSIGSAPPKGPEAPDPQGLDAFLGAPVRVEKLEPGIERAIDHVLYSGDAMRTSERQALVCHFLSIPESERNRVAAELRYGLTFEEARANALLAKLSASPADLGPADDLTKGLDARLNEARDSHIQTVTRVIEAALADVPGLVVEGRLEREPRQGDRYGSRDNDEEWSGLQVTLPGNPGIPAYGDLGEDLSGPHTWEIHVTFARKEGHTTVDAYSRAGNVALNTDDRCFDSETTPGAIAFAVRTMADKMARVRLERIVESCPVEPVHVPGKMDLKWFEAASYALSTEPNCISRKLFAAPPRHDNPERRQVQGVLDGLRAADRLMTRQANAFAPERDHQIAQALEAVNSLPPSFHSEEVNQALEAYRQAYP